MALNLTTMSGERIRVSEVRLYPEALIRFSESINKEIEDARRPWLVMGTPLALISTEIGKAIMDKSLSSSTLEKLNLMNRVIIKTKELAVWFKSEDISFSSTSGLREAVAMGEPLNLNALFPIEKPGFWTRNRRNMNAYEKGAAIRNQLSQIREYITLPGADYLEIKTGGQERSINPTNIEALSF